MTENAEAWDIAALVFCVIMIVAFLVVWFFGAWWILG
jgi:hypothetical protein